MRTIKDLRGVCEVDVVAAALQVALVHEVDEACEHEKACEQENGGGDGAPGRKREQRERSETRETRNARR